MRNRLMRYCVLSLIVVASIVTIITFKDRLQPSNTESYIVQAQSLEQAIALVHGVGGEITHELSIISAVGARLNLEQLHALRSKHGIRRVYRDRSVSVSVVDSARMLVDGRQQAEIRR